MHMSVLLDKMFTRMNKLKRHMKQQHCDDVTMKDRRNYFFHSIVTKVHFGHPVILYSTVIQHTTAIQVTHTTLYIIVYMYIDCIYSLYILMMHSITIGPVEGCSTVTTIHLQVHKPQNLNHGQNLNRIIIIMILSFSAQDKHQLQHQK